MEGCNNFVSEITVPKHFRLWGLRDKGIGNNSWVYLENIKVYSLKAKKTGILKSRDNRPSKMTVSISMTYFVD